MYIWILLSREYTCSFTDHARAGGTYPRMLHGLVPHGLRLLPQARLLGAVVPGRLQIRLHHRPAPLQLRHLRTRAPARVIRLTGAKLRIPRPS